MFVKYHLLISEPVTEANLQFFSIEAKFNSPVTPKSLSKTKIFAYES